MYDNEGKAFIATTGQEDICLNPEMANRHGLITGATGTGKTVTLQTLAETFSQMGVPVFAADVKGDLSGVAAAGGNKDSVKKRVESYKLNARGFRFQAFPVEFWDVFGEQGTAIRGTITEMGPLLLSRLLNLNETQSAVLTVVFRIAQDEKLELVDLKDLQKMLEYTGNNTGRFSAAYGNLSTASLGAIQRGLLGLEQEGAASFFGEPSLLLDDLLQTSGNKGVINILAADRLISSPKVYTTFLLWLMTKLFETLPEAGDIDKPKLIFFFDEAHLLFADAPRALIEKVEQVVRLIRSKGVGLYFISQTPADMPDSVLSQLGNRIQHALRAYTPKDQKSLKAAAQSFRPNPAFDTETAISELETGEALISFLDAKGAPQPVERGFILPPQGQIGPLAAEERARLLTSSLLNRHYAQAQDRTTAYEMLNERLANLSNAKEQMRAEKEAETNRLTQEKQTEKERKKQEKAYQAEQKAAQRAAEQQKKFWASTIRQVVVPVVKQVLKSLFKK